MKRYGLLLLAAFGILAFAAFSPETAEGCDGRGGGGGAAGNPGLPGGGCGGGCGDGGCGPAGPKCPSEALGGTASDSDEATGQVFWVESSGEASPEVTSIYDEPKGGEKAREIVEIEKARDELKPVLVFFCKPRDLLAFGDKSAKDPEVAACESLDGALWKRIRVSERSLGFVCVRVNAAKADPALLKRHGVARSPVVEILDLDGKQAHFSVSPSIPAVAFCKILDEILAKAEKEIRRLAKLEEDTPRVRRAKERAQEFAQRDLYRDGLKALDKSDWARAEKAFQDALALPAASDWKDKARVALVETEAGRGFQNAEALCKAKRYREAEAMLQKIVSECKESKFFAAQASEKLDWVRKKLVKDK
ncbi:MAG: hypothetical protein MUC63_08110 [Planctomycetes bacterium]|jgi:hypothetical protein|nr:hypothetical protein [Planctomycetota bacterium]